MASGSVPGTLLSGVADSPIPAVVTSSIAQVFSVSTGRSSGSQPATVWATRMAVNANPSRISRWRKWTSCRFFSTLSDISATRSICSCETRVNRLNQDDQFFEVRMIGKYTR